MTANGPQRVVWSEGLLIGPQHLQQLDLYHERLLSMRLEAVEALPWGVVRCEIDPVALSAGQVRVLRLQAVMPDGAVLALDEGDAELPPLRHVDHHFPAAEAKLELFVGLLREREGIDNYSQSDDALGRYRIARREVRDTTSPQQRAEVGFGQRNAVLLFGDEPQDDYVVLKLAEIGHDHKGQLLLLDAFVPPCLRVSASSFLVGGLRRLLETMGARRRALDPPRPHITTRPLHWTAHHLTT
jgi:type VI secretion system protein ImpJ